MHARNRSTPSSVDSLTGVGGGDHGQQVRTLLTRRRPGGWFGQGFRSQASEIRQTRRRRGPANGDHLSEIGFSGSGRPAGRHDRTTRRRDLQTWHRAPGTRASNPDHGRRRARRPAGTAGPPWVPPPRPAGRARRRHRAGARPCAGPCPRNPGTRATAETTNGPVSTRDTGPPVVGLATPSRRVRRRSGRRRRRGRGGRCRSPVSTPVLVGPARRTGR